MTHLAALEYLLPVGNSSKVAEMDLIKAVIPAKESHGLNLTGMTQVGLPRNPLAVALEDTYSYY